MSQRRRARLNEQFKREISEILRTQVHDPRIGAPTVTGVDATPDLWSARIFVRPGPTSEETDADEQLLAGLRAATPFIRRTLGQTLTLRRVPELRFELDETLDRALRIEAILREVLPEDEEPENEEPEGEEAQGLKKESDGGGGSSPEEEPS
jgi:ribosome-binding factor A